MDTRTARIFVNNIEVGSLPAAQYTSIVERVQAQRSLYAVQAGNIVATASRFMMAVLRCTAWLWLVAILVLAIADRSALAEIIAAIRTLSPTEMAETIRLLAIGSIAFGLCAGGFTVVFIGRCFGCYNVFEDAINRRVRALLEVPSEGNMRVEMAPVGGGHE